MKKKPKKKYTEKDFAYSLKDKLSSLQKQHDPMQKKPKGKEIEAWAVVSDKGTIWSTFQRGMEIYRLKSRAVPISQLYKGYSVKRVRIIIGD